MDSTIKIALLPLDIIWSDYTRNLQSVAEALPSLHPDTDVLVLPELFSTGFIQDEMLLPELARKSSEATLEALHRWCRQFNIAICGSFLSVKGSDIVNRGFFIEPSGDEAFYDKRHLFCLSMESKLYRNGAELPPVVRFRGWNISMIICYDLRFPVWCRNDAQKYDVMLVPANWPESRGYAWKQLLIARAIENQAIVAGANRSGHDDYGTYDNLSFIFDPLGKEISTPASDGCRFVYARYSKSRLEKVRTYLPVGNDADDFNVCGLTK